MKYLPTLQLKKALLQAEVNHTVHERDALVAEFDRIKKHISEYSMLFSFEKLFDFFTAIEIRKVDKSYENVAGVEIPSFEGIEFADFAYSLFDTPVWFDAATDDVKNLLTFREKIKVIEEKKRALEKELKEVSIRVNLFEKIMIPRAQENIKKIKIFLGDQQLAAVAQAKVSKKKIMMREKQREHL